jgi:mevalonate kinase
MNAESVERSASGKIILCGEHSVVYGRPAIAVPVSAMRVCARVEPAPKGSGLQIHAPDLQQKLTLKDADNEHPLALGARLALEHLMAPAPDAILTLRSDLPIAAGLGSGASVAAATARALAATLGTELSPEVISEITYEVEKIHHGNPSGIDNTVIAWEKPVYFVKGTTPETFSIHTPFKLLIAYSGIAGSTRTAVAEVRRRWEAAPGYYNVIFNCIGAISKAARAAVEQGEIETLGALLNENHELLMKMGVSLPELDGLAQAARRAGALGAKMTGSGYGGNIIALVEVATTAAVKEALSSAGAHHIWETQVGQPDG